MHMFCCFEHRYSTDTTYCHLGTIALHKCHIWACCQSHFMPDTVYAHVVGACLSGLKGCHARNGSSRPAMQEMAPQACHARSGSSRPTVQEAAPQGLPCKKWLHAVYSHADHKPNHYSLTRHMISYIISVSSSLLSEHYAPSST